MITMDTTLIIGHSQVRYFKDYISNGETTKSLCFAGCKVKDLLSFEAVRRKLPAASVIVVLCGTNDITSSTVGDLLEGFEKLFYGIRDVNPKAHVVLSSILPRGHNMHQTGTHYNDEKLRDINDKITVVNEALRKAQYITDNLTFLDHPQFLLDHKLLALDGLHLSYKGTMTVVKNIEYVVKQVSHVKPSESISPVKPSESISPVTPSESISPVTPSESISQVTPTESISHVTPSESISHVTAEMREMFKSYPEIVFMDATYNTNIEGYALFVIMVEDSDGRGKPIAYCYQRSETKENLDKTLDYFCQYNDTTPIRIVMVDKDMNELGSIKSKIPHANILLCKFHVSKYLKKVISDLDIKRDDKIRIADLVKKIINARSQEEYDSTYVELAKCDETFVQYFNKNWHRCQKLWVMHFRNELQTHGNNTNNKLECHNEKVKHYVSKHMALPESIEHLQYFIKDTFARTAYNQYLNLKTKINVHHQDKDTVQYSLICNSKGFAVINEEVKLMKQTQYEVTKNDDGFTVGCGNNTYDVSRDFTKCTKCTCITFCNYLLPCRHIFVCRKTHNLPIFESSLIPDRWKKDTDQVPFISDSLPKNIKIKQRKPSQKPGKMTTVQKFNFAYTTCRDIASFLSTCGENELFEKIEFLKRVKNDWQCSQHPSESISHVTPSESMSHVTPSESMSHVTPSESMSDVTPSESMSHVTPSESMSHVTPSESMSDVTPSESMSHVTPSESMSHVTPSESMSDVTPSESMSHVTPSESMSESKSHVTPSESISHVTPSESISRVTPTASISHVTPAEATVSESDGVQKPSFEDMRDRIILLPVKSRRGRPKGSKKPFWEFSGKSKQRQIVKKKRKTPDSESEECKETTHETVNKKRRCKKFELTSKNKSCIGNGHMLTDDIIEGTQSVLTNQFTHINGFQPPSYKQNMKHYNQVSLSMVQVLFRGNLDAGHWFTVSTVDCKNGEINCYDSHYNSLDMESQLQICTILKYPGDSIKVNNIPVPKQAGTSDCGMFALAYAVAICLGNDPSKMKFDQQHMRTHLIDCVQSGSFTNFPFKKYVNKKKNDTTVIDIFCDCRCLYNSAMVQCANCLTWLHTHCVENNTRRKIRDDMSFTFNCKKCSV